MPRNLVLFTRDLRLVDNKLIQPEAENIACFIIDTHLLSAHHNRFATHFMAESLEDLAGQLHAHHSSLNIETGRLKASLEKLIRKFQPDSVSVSHDNTPYGLKREQIIKHLSAHHNIELHIIEQHTLLPLASITKPDRSPYRVFTPFLRSASHHSVPHPIHHRAARWLRDDAHTRVLETLLQADSINIQSGGRQAAQKILRGLTTYRDYTEQRDIPALDATTHLSAHLHWGTVSAREVYHAIADSLSPDHGLIRQLWWREFYYVIAHHFPHVWRHSFDQRFDHIHWEHDTEALTAWQIGQTGFPIVDAAMRCLNATGAMHNRSRMITASFLVKDLGINWREGERYFAQTLIDYDKTLNNGNWQWVAGTGVDAAPYFRVFNPWLQQAKFDPEATFIRQWLPELKTLEARDIHNPEAERPGYPRPMLDHAHAAQVAIARYKRVT